MLTLECWGEPLLIPNTIGESYGAALTATLRKFCAGIDGVTHRTSEEVVYPVLKSTDLTLTAGGTITPASPCHRLQGSPGAVTLSLTNAIADGEVDGQLLTLVGGHATNVVTIKDGANVDLNATNSITLALGQTLQLRWSEDRALWENYGAAGAGTSFHAPVEILNANSLRFYELTSNGTNFIFMHAPSSLAANYELQLPSAQGGVNTFLRNNGAGVLSWASSTSSLQAAYDGGEEIAVGVPINLTGSGVLLSVVGDVTLEDLTGTNADFSEDISAGETITAGTGLTVTTGGADVTGDVVVHSGGVRLDNTKYLLLEDSANAASNGIGLTAGDVLEVGDDSVDHQISIQTGEEAITFSTDGSERMRVTEDGMLGWGVTSPGGDWDVLAQNDPGVFIFRSATEDVGNGIRISLGTGTGTYTDQELGRITGICTQAAPSAIKGAVHISANRGDNLQIGLTVSDDGGVGIGSVTPTPWKLRVQPDGGRSGIFLDQAESAIGMQISQGTDFNALVLAKTTGNTNPVLSINNSTSADSIADDSGAKLTSAGVWTDAPCVKGNKFDIESVAPDKDFCAKLGKLNFAKYRRRKDEPRQRYGFFLDELADLFGFDTDGVSPTELASLALGSVKGLMARVEALEAKVGI